MQPKLETNSVIQDVFEKANNAYKVIENAILETSQKRFVFDIPTYRNLKLNLEKGTTKSNIIFLKNQWRGLAPKTAL